MRFLLNPFLIFCGIFAALLFWWRPAPELICMKSVDWAHEYEKQHTPSKHLLGAMEMARELIRSDSPHAPFTEFIDRKTRDQLIVVATNDWQSWGEKYFPRGAFSPKRNLYFSPDDSPIDELKDPQGYVELRGKNTIHFVTYNRLEARELDRYDIPNSLRYPYRNFAIIMFCAALLFWGVSRVRKRVLDLPAASSAGTGCRGFLVGMCIGVALTLLPFLYYNGEAGIPAFFLGVVSMLAGAIGLVFFGLQVSMVRKMIGGKDQLAHWTYDPSKWKRFIDWHLNEEKEAKWGLFVFITIIIAAVGVGFWLAMRDTASLWVLFFLLGLIVLLWLVAIVAPRLTYRRLKKGSGQVYLGKSGIYLNGAVHTWNLIGSRLESVELIQKPFPMLVFVYSYLMMAGRSLFFFRQYASVHVPVPDGKEAEATKVVNSYIKKG